MEMKVTISMDSEVTKMINERLDKMQEELDRMKRVLQMAVSNFAPGGEVQ